MVLGKWSELYFFEVHFLALLMFLLLFKTLLHCIVQTRIELILLPQHPDI